MSETGGIDVLMQVVGTGTTAYNAESHTVFYTDSNADTLRGTDFVPGKFCELQQFDFSAGVESALSKNKDKDKEKEDKPKQGEPAPKREGSAFGGGQTYREKMETIYRGQADKREQRGETEFVDMQPVGFTRVVDTMSTQLFTALATCDTLASVSIVKRKAVGNFVDSGLCYLRLDFSQVLITSLDWKDSGHVMIETGSFIYRKMTLRYRPQKPDGSLGATLQMAWQMKAAGKG